ncbi:purpurin-like [Pecten maximus]|uniref:purpurin-like n=1 Tax=Pecten maximus TaxID=6579 RepID=UPI001458E722|nr:purpurin-like [Pecten maximus]
MEFQRKLVLCLVFLCYIKSNLSQGNQPCFVNQFEMEKNFTLNDFQGEWYVISIRNQWTAQNGGAFLGSSMRHRYTMGSHRTLTVETNLQGSMLGCMRFENTASPDPFSNMTKFTIVSQDSEWRRFVFGSTIWIVRTNHRGFAVVYSCGNVRADGTCEVPTAYTLNRNWNGHTPEELKQIDEALTSVCVHPHTLLPVAQLGECVVNEPVLMNTMG